MLEVERLLVSTARSPKSSCVGQSNKLCPNRLIDWCRRRASILRSSPIHTRGSCRSRSCWELGSAKDETAMHTESGYWRPQRDGSIEVVIAHNFGIVEIQEGTIEGTTIDLRSAAVTSTTSAKKIEGLARKYVVDGDS